MSQPADCHAPKAAMATSLVVALVLRLLLLAERRGGLGLGSGDPAWATHVLDAAYYDEMARQILGLDGSSGGLLLDAPFGMAPLYGYLLAGAYALFGADDPTPVYLLQALAGGLTAALAAWLSARLATAGSSAALAAWIGGLAVATYPVAVHYDISLLSVSLSTLLTVTATAALVLAWRRGAGLCAALVGGLALGAAVTARGNLLVIAPLIVLAFLLRGWGAGAGWRRGLVSAGALVLGLGLPLGLTAGHNLVVGGELVLVSANGGINLYQGNNPYVVSDPVQTIRLPAHRDAIAAKSRLVASRETGEWLTPAQSDRYWLGRVLGHWREDPVRYLGLFLRKLHQTLSGDERGDNTDLRNLAESSAVLSRLPWLYGLLAVLGVTGLVVSARGTLDPLRRPDLPARLVLSAGLASIALFFVLSRYRLALAPVLFAYAGVAVAWLVATARAARWRPLAGASVYIVLVGLVLRVDPLHPWLPSSLMADQGLRAPPPCMVDTHLLREPRIEAEYRRAKAELIAGERGAASQRLGALLQADPAHRPAAVDLSALLIERRDLRGAVRLSEAVLEQDGCDDKAWANLGTARLLQGRPGDAARAFQEAHRLDPYAPEYEAALGEALLEVGEEDQALALLEAAVKWGPELWQPRALLGRRALGERRYGDAAELLRQAVALAPDRMEIQAMLGLSLVGAGDVPAARVVLRDAKARGMGRHAAIIALEQGIARVDPALPPALPPATP